MAPQSATTSPETIGFIGIGNMGAPMATKIMAGGYRLRAFDANKEAAQKFAAATGAVVADTLDDLSECSVVVLMVPDGKIVRSIVLGDGATGLQAICRPGTTIIDMSSSEPTGTRALGEALREKGIALVDAPVSGGVKRAVSGTLAIMAGGERADIVKIEPVLRTMGSIIETGAIGSGHAMKALNNYVSAAGLLAACEALEVGERFGIDPDVIVRTLNSSTGKNNSTEHKLAQFIVSGAFNSGFSLGLMRKDLETAVALAKAMQAGTPLADTLLGAWRESERRYGKAADHTEIHRLVEDTSEAQEPESGSRVTTA